MADSSFVIFVFVLVKHQRPTIIKVLKGLQKSGEIVRTKLNKLNTLTSIVKYDDYQVGYKSSSKNFLATSLAEQQLNSNILLTSSSIYNNIGQHEKILNDMLKGGILLEGFCKAEGITQSQFKKLAREVINEWKLVKIRELVVIFSSKKWKKICKAINFDYFCKLL